MNLIAFDVGAWDWGAGVSCCMQENGVGADNYACGRKRVGKELFKDKRETGKNYKAAVWDFQLDSSSITQQVQLPFAKKNSKQNLWCLYTFFLTVGTEDSSLGCMCTVWDKTVPFCSYIMLWNFSLFWSAVKVVPCCKNENKKKYWIIYHVKALNLHLLSK